MVKDDARERTGDADAGGGKKSSGKKASADNKRAKKKGKKRDAKTSAAKKRDKAARKARKASAAGEPPQPDRAPAGHAVAAHAHAYPARARRAARSHALVYVRVPRGQKSSRTAEDVDRARALAAQRGWLVADAHVVVDTVDRAAAADTHSDGWTRIEGLLDTGAADIVVGVDLDRFAPSLSDVVQLVDAGARVVLTDGTLDLTAADGAVQAGLLAAVDAFQTRRRGDRHRRAIRDRAAAGRPEVSGRRAFGFAQDGVTVVDAEADVVRRIYADFIGGATVYGIAAALTAEGAPLGTGRSWNRTRVRSTLRSPIYRGAVIHHGKAVRSDAVPAIVGDQAWRKAQRILDDPARRVTPGPSRQHLLSGVLACGVEGCPGYAAYAQGRYHCAVSSRHPTVRADVAEGIARRAVARAVITSGADIPSRPDIDPYAADAVGRVYDGLAVASTSDADDIIRTVETLFDRETVERQRDVVRALLRLHVVQKPRANTIAVARVPAARR